MEPNTASNRRRIALVLAAAFVAVAAIVRAALPADSTVIYACVENRLGLVRIVAPGTTCTNLEHPLSWNQMGPPGPPGDAGPPGPAGAFGGSFVSGDSSIIVADGGVVLSGPGGLVTIDARGVAVTSDAGIAVTGPSGVVDLNGDGVAVSSDGGVALIGPTGVVTLDDAGVEVNGASVAGAPGAVQINASAVRLNGTVIELNVSADGGARSAARVGDSVSITDGGSITSGSSSVYIGP